MPSSKTVCCYAVAAAAVVATLGSASPLAVLLKENENQQQRVGESGRGGGDNGDHRVFPPPALSSDIAGADTTGPTTSPPPPSLYTNWMGQLFPILADYTLLDLSLPGTHDTMTYDLSTSVADNSNSMPAFLAEILHDLSPILSELQITEFIRSMAKTQGLTVTEQLNNGVRFIDFRVTYTAPPNVPSNRTDLYDWYCLHLVQSNKPALHYFSEIYDWLVANPMEIVVIWVSKHGSNCATEYGVDPLIMQAFWQQIERVFSGGGNATSTTGTVQQQNLMFNPNVAGGLLNETTIRTLIEKNQRAIFYAAQYEKFTNSSPNAMSDCHLANTMTKNDSPLANVQTADNLFKNAQSTILQQKSKNNFYLQSFAGPTVDAHLPMAFELSLLPPFLINTTAVTDACAKLYNISGVTSGWCPLTLQSSSQWANYYLQIPFAAAMADQKSRYWGTGTGSSSSSGGGGQQQQQQQQVYRMPNAIYIDAVDVDGTIRTGAEDFFPAAAAAVKKSNGDNTPTTGLTNKFSYVGNIILSTLYWACSGQLPNATAATAKASADGRAADCRAFIAELEQMTAQFPQQSWDAPNDGRVEGWPTL